MAQDHRETPFWSDLGQTLLYPLRGDSGLTLLGLTMAGILGLLPVLGFVINLLLTVALYKYGFEVLKASADGEVEPPLMRRDVPDGAGWAQIGLQFLFAFAAVAGFLHLPFVLWLLFLLLLAVMFPAALMLLAMTESLFEAVNPARLIEVWQRMGAPYLLLAVLILLVRLCELLFQLTIGALMPPLVGTLVGFFIGGWAALVSYRLMGRAIHQYRDNFDYVPEPPTTPLSRPRLDPDQDRIDEAEAVHAQRGAAAAAQVLAEHLRERGGTDAVHLRYRQWLREADDRAALLAHGQQYLNVLLANERSAEAVKLLLECQTLDSRFQPAGADLVHELAEAAAQAGESKAALLLLNSYLHASPDHAHLPKNGLLAAQLLARSPSGRGSAIKLLRSLQARFQRHTLRAEIDRMLIHLEGGVSPS
ncbi:MAG: hypothetical protein R3F15_10475 [Lysobacterales bacterium]